MKAVIKIRTNNAVHAPHLNINGTPETCCGLTGGHWTSTNQVVSCQSCIRMMAAQVSRGISYYRNLLWEALDAEFVKTAIKPITPMDTSYSEHLEHGFHSREIRQIKEKMNELTEVVNAIVVAQEGV